MELEWPKSEISHITVGASGVFVSFVKVQINDLASLFQCDDDDDDDDDGDDLLLINREPDPSKSDILDIAAALNRKGSSKNDQKFTKTFAYLPAKSKVCQSTLLV